jgi:glutamate synthase (ferredoxin)
MMLYDPTRDERDACGIGFVADAMGRSSRSIMDAALEALCRMRHRGAIAADAHTGDGAGILAPIPRRLLGAEAAGVAMVFSADDRASRPIVESACRAEGIEVGSWRTVPTDGGALGPQARASSPVIEQALLTRPEAGDDDELERRAFRARRRIEGAARERGLRLYVPSLSFRTVTYKALCAAEQLAAFYPDLADGRFEAWFAVLHQRYSTNTMPTWERAQPFRFLAHNGEINTVRGNVALMRARETRLGAPDLAADELLTPVVDAAGSDSAILDEVLELLVRAGRDLMHASSMTVPPAWEQDDGLDERTRAFWRYHSCLLEPWDGPAALVFSDGRSVGAALDRNGLRPLRVAVCDDGLVVCASEAGAVSLQGRGRVRRLKLGPGQRLCVAPAAGLLDDGAIGDALARRRPYGSWVARHLRECSPGGPVGRPAQDLAPRQVAAGFSKEEMTVVLRPMALEAQEPTSSMGDDTVQPPFAAHGRPVFGFLKQRFAQVTNPPIDHLRERHVMSLTTRLGLRAELLREAPEAAALRAYPTFLLRPSAVAELESAGGHALDATFDIGDGPEGLAAACARLGAEARSAVAAGAQHLIVTNRAAGPERASMPTALAAGAVHHALVAGGLRSRVGIVVDGDDARDSHHAACLLTNGADALCPRLAFETIADLVGRGRLGGSIGAEEAQDRYCEALEEGVLKIMSKMGISTLDSYRGAQIIEAVGLGREVIDLCFAGIFSALDGLSFTELGADVLLRHFAAHAAKPVLANTGFIKFRKGGEYHATNPEVVDALQASAGLDADQKAAHHLLRAVRGSPEGAQDDEGYRRFAALVDERPPTEPRDLLELIASSAPVPLETVEPASDIARRFSTGAMSHGALSSEAHETLSLALNMIGGKANTGEGGESPERYRDGRNSAIKQVASGRFGVTPAYLAWAAELQIKMAQGSKPGEGGQIPGSKVTEEIARLRHTVPGVSLISPPPHHDIYSIEDLAQLIFDLRQANPAADISVKLVASEGVGTIAAGVVKGLADVVHISGADGGTGASPLSSIKNAGLPWEIGLADTQAALVANGLRSRARIRVDGGLKTGRDIVVAALLGADEYSFGTAALVAEGCILVRTCHRNTCPVGIATQDPELRKRFAGTPEMVARYLLLVAEDVRGQLARLGLRSLDDAIGRTDLLRQKRTGDVRADRLDLAPLRATRGDERRFRGPSMDPPRSALGDRLYADAMEPVTRGRSVELGYRISTSDRTVGARLGCALARAEDGSRRGTVSATFEGAAGQSFGAFASNGMHLTLIGEANDYVCKGMAGGRVVLSPPPNDAGDPYLVGNTGLYGATGGQLYVAGRAGERFAVRNSGAVAVVEGAGDHACEYMTAGAVVILGPTGRNLGAGMSGGEVYLYDPSATIATRINPQLVAAYQPSAAQLVSLRRTIRRHVTYTGSKVAQAMLADWGVASRSFVRIAPMAEIARLEALFEGTAVSAA